MIDGEADILIEVENRDPLPGDPGLGDEMLQHFELRSAGRNDDICVRTVFERLAEFSGSGFCGEGTGSRGVSGLMNFHDETLARLSAAVTPV